MKARKYTEPHVKELSADLSFESLSRSESITQIIQSYQDLMLSLNAKIEQLTVDLELTRNKLGVTETRFATLLGFVRDDRIDVNQLLDKIDCLERQLVEQGAELSRLRLKVIETASSSENESEDRKDEIPLLERKNLSNYFNFEAIRNDDEVLSRKRKNSIEEQVSSAQWEKALSQYSKDCQTSTRFKEKTFAYMRKFIPHEQRLKVWPIIFENQLGINNNLLVELQERRAKGMVEAQVINQIRRDIDRSFNCRTRALSRDGLAAEVQEILELFHLLRPDVSYVQGMTYPAIVLASVVGKIEALSIFSNLILCNKFLREMYSFEPHLMEVFWQVFDILLADLQADVAKHLRTLGIQSQIFLTEWFFTLFSRGHSLETTMKIWDLLGFQGEAVLYRLSISIFELIGKRLLTLNYEHTLGLIQSYWSYTDEAKLLEHLCQSRVGIDKIQKAFQKANRAQRQREGL